MRPDGNPFIFTLADLDVMLPLALAMGLAPAVIITGAIWNAVAFLSMGALGVDKWVHRLFPKPVVRGIQLELAYLLFKSAWGLVTQTPKGWEAALPVVQIGSILKSTNSSNMAKWTSPSSAPAPMWKDATPSAWNCSPPRRWRARPLSRLHLRLRQEQSPKHE